MKKTLCIILTFLMMLLVFPTSAFSINSRDGLDSWEPSTSNAMIKATDLYAGQSNDIGDVLIDTLGKEQYLVTYVITEPSWYISEIHFEGISGADELSLITNKGGIIPGKLSMSQTFAIPIVNETTGVISGGTQRYSFLYTASKPIDSFAAHAVVYQVNSGDKETAWGKGDVIPGNNWSMYFTKGYLKYKLVDTVSVPSTSTAGVDSSIILENGKEYKLYATGTFTYNSGSDWADAEWYLKNGEVVKGDTEGSKPYVLDVSVGDTMLNNDWGAYNSEHIYTMDYIGTGSKLHFSIYDSYSGDNFGSIEVKIFEKQW